jgi:hypothetical protein
VNGPATAQIGLRIDHQKQNWATTTQVGEIDGLYVRILQGGPGSDTAGVLVDVQSRGQGFTAGHEYIVSTVDSGFNLTNRVGSQLASIDGPTGQINGHTLSVTGATAFSATGLVMQSTAPADWDTFIRCTQQGSDKFVVSGAGLVTSYDHFSAPTPQGYLYIAGNPGAGSTVGGSYFTWNFAGVSGGTAFLNNKGGGTGGFLFGEVDNAGTVTPRLSIDGTGAVAVAGAFSAATISAPQVYANTALNLISNGGAKIFYDSGLSGIQFYVGGNAAEITGSGTFQIFGTQVITTRKTGWGVASGGSRAAFNSGTATLPQTAAALAALIFDLTAHGLIGA